MKFILILPLLSLLTACELFKNDSSGNSSSAPTSSYGACAPVPAGTIVDHSGCPGSSGTWNNYEIKKDSAGVVISIDLYCGGGDTEHAMDQAEYDTYAGSGEVSNNDYKLGSDCVSGSRTETLTGDVTVNIWQKI